MLINQVTDNDNMRGRLETGIEELDRQLNGGFPPGSIIAYCAPPASQCELLLYELTAVRPTLYLTTDRTKQSIIDAFERTSAPTGNPRVHHVTHDALIENTREMSRSISEGSNLIVDPIDPLERQERNRYERFLNELQNQMRNTESIALLHCLRTKSEEPPLRATTEHMADVILDFNVQVRGTDIETRLAVPKFRGGTALTQTIKLELTERVRIDTSRDIA